MMIDPRAKLLRFSTTRRNTVASHSEPRIAASVSPTSVVELYVELAEDLEALMDR